MILAAIRQFLPRFVVCSIALLVSAPCVAADKPHVVFLVGESDHYGSRRTMPELAKELRERHGFKVTYIDNEQAARRDRSIKPKSLHGIEVIPEADLLIMFLRFREPTEAQKKILTDYFNAGKPAVAFRTTSHLFWEDKGWFVPFFGGHYKGHGSNSGAPRR